jgi:putative heme-binding domain-containing protein
MWRPAVALLLAAAWIAHGQHSSATITNPYNSADDRTQGGRTYRSQCAACHGPDAKGGSGGPDLSRGRYKHAASEEAMFRVITKGVPGTAMPGFALDGKLAWQLVAFLRGLNEETGGITGDARRGARLFIEVKCATCHSGKAPDLGDAALRLTRAELRLALLDPDAEVAPEYWQWRWRLSNGSSVEGRRMNEDTYSVQALLAGRLRTIAKHDIVNSEHVKKSKMPSFGKLPSQDIDDIVAYLVAMRGAGQ